MIRAKRPRRYEEQGEQNRLLTSFIKKQNRQKAQLLTEKKTRQTGVQKVPKLDPQRAELVVNWMKFSTSNFLAYPLAVIYSEFFPSARMSPKVKDFF